MDFIFILEDFKREVVVFGWFLGEIVVGIWILFVVYILFGSWGWFRFNVVFIIFNWRMEIRLFWDVRIEVIGSVEEFG